MVRPWGRSRGCRTDVNYVIDFLKSVKAVVFLGIVDRRRTEIFYTRDCDIVYPFDIFCYDVKTLRNMLETAGIKVLDVGPYGSFKCPKAF